MITSPQYSRTDIMAATASTKPVQNLSRRRCKASYAYRSTTLAHKLRRIELKSSRTKSRTVVPIGGVDIRVKCHDVNGARDSIALHGTGAFLGAWEIREAWSSANMTEMNLIESTILCDLLFIVNSFMTMRRHPVCKS
jgi:hypothetical protein